MNREEEVELARTIRVNALADDNRAATEIQSLRADLGRLSLFCQAMWELLEKRVGLSEEELLALIDTIDLRDGKNDGQITRHAVRCPTCQRVCNSKQKRCMYCGLEFHQSAAPQVG